MGLNKESSQKNLEKLNQQPIESVDVGIDLASNGFLTSTVEGLGLLVQARMEVGRVNDPAEHEADAIALDFLRWQQSSGEQSAPTQQQISSGQTSRSTSGGTMETGGFAVDGALESEIAQETGRGSGLDHSTRGQFEGYFGVDLGGVRVHADNKAAELSRSLGAEAFTVGNDVFFGEGRFNSGSSSGMGLLAHELAHVVQQGSSPMRRVDQNSVRISRSPVGNAVIYRKISSSDAIKITGAGVLFKKVGELLQSCNELYTSLKDEKSNSQILLDSSRVLRTSADATRSSLDVVVKAGGGMGGAITQAIPGIGLITSFMSLVDNLLIKIQPLINARRTARATLVELNKKTADLPPGSPEHTKVKVNISAVKRLISESSWKLGVLFENAALDAVAIGGHIAKLTVVGAPVGTVITLAAVASKMFVGAVDTVRNWHAASTSKEAEVAYDKAEEELGKLKDSKDTLAIEKFQKDRDDAYQVLVSKSTRFAMEQLLVAAFQGMRAGEDFCEPGIRKLLLSYGVTDAFINDTEAQFRSAKLEDREKIKIKSEVALLEVGKLLEVGEPKFILERVEGWLKAIGEGVGIAWGMAKSAGTAVSASVLAGKERGAQVGKEKAGSFGRIVGATTGAIVGPIAAGGRAVKEFFSSKPPPKFESDVEYEYVEKEVKSAVESALVPIKTKVKPGVGVTDKILNQALEKPYANLLARFIPKDSVDRRAQMNEMVTLKVKDWLRGMRSDGKEIDVLLTKITFTKTSIKILLALKKDRARSEIAIVPSKAAVETSVVNPMHADTGISDRATRVGQMGAKSSPTTSQ